MTCPVCHAKAAEDCVRLAAEYLKVLTPAVVRVEAAADCECSCHPDSEVRMAALFGWPNDTPSAAG